MPKMTSTLTNQTGTDLTDQSGTQFTLGRACIMALDAALPEDREEGLQPKLKRGKLIEEIEAAAIAGKDLQFTAEDTALLKSRISKTFTAASVVRKLCKLLDPAIE